jgi:hypothetical protein
VIALSKTGGTFLGQFRVQGGSKAWADLRSWYVAPGLAETPDELIWINGSSVHRTALEASTSASGSPAPAGSPRASSATTPGTSALPAP